MDYRLLLLIHILAGTAWVGGALAIVATVVAAQRSQSPEAVDRVMQSLRWADTWLAIPAPLLVLATGVGMVIVNGAWSFGQLWVFAAIGLVIAYEVIALVVGGPVYRSIAAARAQGLVGSAAHAGTMRAWTRLSVVLLAMLVAIIGLMVFKPGT